MSRVGDDKQTWWGYVCSRIDRNFEEKDFSKHSYY
jgi:hypothetical protein